MAKFLSSKWTKAALFLVCLIPFVRVLLPVMALMDLPDSIVIKLPQNGFWLDLGPNPIEFITHYTGDWTLRFLLITLTITPLRNLLNRPQLTRFRRMLGLFAFFYGMAHFSVWIWLDKSFDLGEMWRDILKRWYITVGMASLLGMVPLAVTSTAGWVRRMGYKKWQKLHRTIYFCAIAGVVHYYLLVKSDVRLPVMYGAILGVLLAYRIVKNMRTPARPAPKRAPVPVSG